MKYNTKVCANRACLTRLYRGNSGTFLHSSQTYKQMRSVRCLCSFFSLSQTMKNMLLNNLVVCGQLLMKFSELQHGIQVYVNRQIEGLKSAFYTILSGTGELSKIGIILNQ